MNIFEKINYIFDKKTKLQAVFLTLGITLGAFFELLGVGLITSLVSLITNPEKIHSSALLSGIYSGLNMTSDEQFFVFVVVSLIVVYILKNVYLLWIGYVQYTYIYDNQLKISGRLIDCYLKKPYTYHLDKNSAEMVRNVMLDSERFFQMLLSVFLTFSEVLVSVLLCAYLLVVDWFITISVVVILAAFTGLYMLLFKGKAKSYGQVNQLYDGKMHQSINQALGAVKDIKILHREKYFVNNFVGFGEKKLTAVRNNNVLGQAPKYFIETVCVGAILVVIMLKLLSGSNIQDMVPQLAAFVVAAVKLLPSVSKINNYLNLIVFLKPSADLIYRDIKDTEDMVDFELADTKDNVVKNTSKDAASIKIENLSFRYPHTDRDVLKAVSFEIPLGVSIGLIGPSGAGKSTLADIILGILTPTEGCVKYGDMNVHEHPIKWSKKLAYIPQSIYLADESIRNNIAFGIPEEEISEENVWSALREAQLADFVKSLPEGLDTQVGERGVRLSGGQRQRIGIARALYSDPEILVLDEATSALDTETETAVMEAIERLHGKKTMIIIAHRLSTIEGCEYVYKVDAGKVAISRNNE